MASNHIPDIQQRDDANEIEQCPMHWLQRWCIRMASRSILKVVLRRLEREQRAGRLTESQHVNLVNVFRRTFLEDTDA